MEAPVLFDPHGKEDQLLMEEISRGMVYDSRVDIGRQVETEWSRKLSDSTGASLTSPGSLPLPDPEGVGMWVNLYLPFNIIVTSDTPFCRKGKSTVSKTVCTFTTAILSNGLEANVVR
jgi:hypothetical protein